MSTVNLSDTALLIAQVLETVAPARAVYKAARAAHNFSRDLCDALDHLDTYRRKNLSPQPPKER